MLCPRCQAANPDGHRFCGSCGTALTGATIANRRVGDPLPKELIEFDRKIPLIAEPGSDRRNRVPDQVREQVREVMDRERNRTSDRQKEIQKDLDSHKYAVVSSSDEDRKVTLPSGFLGLNTEAEPVSASKSGPSKENLKESPKPRAGSNSFWNYDEPPNQVGSGGVSGPSFLGLSDTPEDVEQDEPRGHARVFIAFLVLLALIGLGYKQWDQIRDQTLPFVKNGTQQVILKVKGKGAAPVNDNSTNSSSSNNGAPNIEVAPTNDNLPKPAPPPSTAATNPAADGSAAGKDAANAATDANSPSTTGGVAGAVTGAANGAEAAKSKDEAATTAKTDKSKSDSGDDAVAKADEETAAPAKDSAKKSASASKGRKPSAADRPQIEDEQVQGGGAEYTRAMSTSDPTLQQRLLWQAVKKGNSDASVKLAELYIIGRGVDQSCDQAMMLLRSAAAHSSSRARGKLGAMYATGECVTQDRVQAYHWMSMALEANPNSDWTARYRESIWNQMTAGEKMRAGRER